MSFVLEESQSIDAVVEWHWVWHTILSIFKKLGLVFRHGPARSDTGEPTRPQTEAPQPRYFVAAQTSDQM
jgi:hypothetical protein